MKRGPAQYFASLWSGEFALSSDSFPIAAPCVSQVQPTAFAEVCDALGVAETDKAEREKLALLRRPCKER
jgi:hypothetical protein